jgi:hypothetical protein
MNGSARPKVTNTSATAAATATAPDSRGPAWRPHSTTARAAAARAQVLSRAMTTTPRRMVWVPLTNQATDPAELTNGG